MSRLGTLLAGLFGPLAPATPTWASRMEDRIIDTLGGLIIMAQGITQDDIDQLSGQLTELKVELTDDNARIQTELSRLEAEHPEVDLTELKAAVTALGAQVDTTSQLVPQAAPAPNPGAPTTDGGSTDEGRPPGATTDA